MAAKKTAPKTPTSADVTVFVPRGTARRDDILKSALLAAADQIPPAAIKVTPTITEASEPKTGDDKKTEGRDYQVTITWTPRPTRATTAAEEDEAEATVDKVLETLEPLTAEQIAAATDAGPEG